MKHTLGPWTVVREMDVEYEVRYDNGQYGLASHIQNEADAKLIAAAPDLLEAAKEVLKLANIDLMHGLHETILKKAIAKADGNER